MAKNHLEWVSMLLKTVLTHLKVFRRMNKKHFDNKPRLARVSDREWQEATESVKQLVKWRLFGNKLSSGAHSESVRGMPAEDYYVGEAV